MQFLHGDESTTMYWHNLRALLLRRKAVDTPKEAKRYFYQAQYHIEHAILMAIGLKNIEMTLDLSINTAFFYQAFIPLKLATVEDVLPWYLLTMTYEVKTGFGNQASWGVVFLAEFYLAHRREIENSAFLSELDRFNFNPSTEKFYEQSLKHIKKAGDIRQQVTFLIICYRFWVIQNRRIKARNIARQAWQLIDEAPAAFLTGLRKEGYRDYLREMKKLL